jgi:hypothetical protein
MKKQIIVFLLLSVFIQVVTLILYWMVTFDFLGYNELIHPEELNLKRFYVSLISTTISVIIYSILRLQKKKRESVAAILPAIPFIMMLFLSAINLNGSAYREKFDAKIFSHSGLKPVKMARQLLRDNSFVGLSKKKVTALLGQNFHSNDIYHEDEKHNKIITYNTDVKDVILVIELKNDKVVLVYLDARSSIPGFTIPWRC